MSTVRELISPFFVWKRQSGSGFTQSSKTKYEPHLDVFAEWSSERDVAALSTQLIEFEFLPHWLSLFVARHDREPARNTIRLLHNVLSSFFDYCLRRGLVQLNPMGAIPRPTYEAPMNDWLSHDEDLAMATVRMTPLENIVCGLARLAGLRVEEIVGALIGHVDREAGYLHVFGTKTAAAVRSVVLFPELDAKLERWIALQAAAGFHDDRLPLVSTRLGDPIHASYVWRIVKRVAGRAGVRLHGRDEKGCPIALDETGENVSEVSPHTLRRTFGSDLLNRGVRIEVVSKQLGHADTRITEKAYAKLLRSTQREELLRVVTGYPFFTRDQLPWMSRS